MKDTNEISKILGRDHLTIQKFVKDCKEDQEPPS